MRSLVSIGLLDSPLLASSRIRPIDSPSPDPSNVRRIVVRASLKMRMARIGTLYLAVCLAAIVRSVQATQVQVRRE